MILYLLDDTISAAASRCRVRVIATNENLMVARHTARLMILTRENRDETLLRAADAGSSDR